MKKPIILCVDDEKVVLTSLKAQLKRYFGADYSIETSENGEEAFDFVLSTINEKSDLPVIVSDHIMPGMKGDELLIKVHEKLPKALSIMLTGQADAEAVGNALNNASLYRYISKPWDETDLKMTISEALRSYYNEKKIEEQNAELEKLVQQLKEYNETLEEKVLERTATIQQQNEEITVQRDLLAKNHKNITDSIEYASLIQCALLPSDNLLKTIFPDHFVFFKPRDIVSGDFYWAKKIGNLIYLAVADCTGHGVPGAFMGTLGISLLNELMNSGEIKTPSQVLGNMRMRLKGSLHQVYTQDGMDIALCLIDTEKNNLQFAGGNMSIYITHDNLLEELKGDRMPVGIYHKDDQPFTNQFFQLHGNEMIYLFTDGFLSQFGGEKKFKFSTKRFRETFLNLYPIAFENHKSELDKILSAWQGKNFQVDDILVMGIKLA
ncbi:MAG: response regulator [Bacteroidales bacterium]